MAIDYKYSVVSEEDLQAYLDEEIVAGRAILPDMRGLVAITDKGFGAQPLGSGIAATNHRRFDVVTSDDPLSNAGTPDTTKVYLGVPEYDVQATFDLENVANGVLMVRKSEWTKGGTRVFDLVFIRFSI